RSDADQRGGGDDPSRATGRRSRLVLSSDDDPPDPPYSVAHISTVLPPVGVLSANSARSRPPSPRRARRADGRGNDAVLEGHIVRHGFLMDVVGRITAF